MRLVIVLEFVPTITTSAAIRGTVIDAFAGEGFQVDEYVRPAHQLEAEHHHPDWKWASPTLHVHLVSSLSVVDALKAESASVGAALARVRGALPDLPLGLIIDREDERIALSFRHDDPQAEMLTAMAKLPNDLDSRRGIGWDRARGVWFDLYDG